ncbi:MAG: hypothetical protein ACTSR2_06260 [Candidatus Hodarchaeales archaeon]
MSFKSLISGNTYQILRKTNTILATEKIKEIITNFSQPAEEASLKVIIESCTVGSGTVKITGTVDSVADISETLTFSANGIKNTSKLFSAITNIITTGFIDEANIGNITIEAITLTGQPVVSEQEIFAAMPGWIDFRSGSIIVAVAGVETPSIFRLFCEYNSSIPLLEKDIVVDSDDTRYEIQSINPERTRRGDIHHLECLIKKV